MSDPWLIPLTVVAFFVFAILLAIYLNPLLQRKPDGVSQAPSRPPDRVDTVCGRRVEHWHKEDISRVDYTDDATTVPGWLFRHSNDGWYAYPQPDGRNRSGPWSTWSQAVSAARSVDEREKLAADILNAPFEGKWSGYKAMEKSMGTGVNGSDEVETAASIMRREAARLRREANDIASDALRFLSMKEAVHERQGALRAEARKLEDAASLIEPVVPTVSVYEPIGTKVGLEKGLGLGKSYRAPAGGSVQVGVGAESVQPIPKFEAKEPFAEPYFGKPGDAADIMVIARDGAENYLRAFMIRDEEIEDGFLTSIGGMSIIARRLQRLARPKVIPGTFREDGDGEIFSAR